MTRTEQIFGEQAWLQALEGTALGGEIRTAFTKGTRPPLPALRCTVSPRPRTRRPNVPRRAANKARRRRRRRSAACSPGPPSACPRARRRFRTSGSSILNLRPLADAMRHGGPSGIHPVDPDLIGRPGLQLRLAVTALRAGVLRYVTQDGTIVEEDARHAGTGLAAPDRSTCSTASSPRPACRWCSRPAPWPTTTTSTAGSSRSCRCGPRCSSGATRIIAVVAMPLRIDRDERSYSDDNAGQRGAAGPRRDRHGGPPAREPGRRPAAGRHPDHHRPRRRRGRLLRGGAGPPAHQQGLRMAAGGRRHGRRGRHPARPRWPPTRTG